MYGFRVRRDERKWPLAEVRLFLHQLSIDIIMIVFPRVFLLLRFTTTVHTTVKNKSGGIALESGRPYIALYQYCGQY